VETTVKHDFNQKTGSYAGPKSYFTISPVNTEYFKSGSCALVHRGLCIYFCFRKLIVKDDCLTHSSNVQTVQKVISNPVKKPKTFSSYGQLSLFTEIIDPVFLIRSYYEKLAIENLLP
jgi:hypothetical protein